MQGGTLKEKGWDEPTQISEYSKDCVLECFKGKSGEKPGQEWHDRPREELHEVLRGYTDKVSVQEYKSVNVPVRSPVHHVSCQGCYRTDSLISS